MDLHDINKNLSEIPLPEQTKTALLHVVDIKINNDMEKIMLRMEKNDERFYQKMDAIQQKIIDDKKATEQLIQSNKETAQAEIKVMKWLFGILISIVTIVVSILLYFLQKIIG